MQRLVLATALLAGGDLAGLGANPAITEQGDVTVQRHDELAVLFDRFRARELATARRVDLAEANRVLALRREDGWFTDVPFQDDRSARWDTAGAMRRALLLAQAAHHPAAAGADRERYRDAMLGVLDVWIAERPDAPNWWWNEIGVPRIACQLYPLVEPWLDGPQREGMLAIIGRSELRGSGANLLWAAELHVQLGTFANDLPTVELAVRRAVDEIAVGAAQGIQVDHSFYQHGPRLQQFHYGASMLDSATALAAVLHDTRFAFADATLAILAGAVLDGSRWMQRGGHTVPATLDRAATRGDALRVRGLASVAQRLSRLHEARRDELDALAAHVAAGAPAAGPPVTGMRYHWRSDFATWHRAAASFFVKTVSDRTHHTEQINSENLLGEYLNAGAHYLLVRGDEYLNVMPAWNWQRVPGTTTFADPARRAFPQRSPLAGGVEDGRGGAVAFEMAHEHETASLRARKAWFFDDDAIVALGAGLTADADVLTTLNQCRLNGPVVAEVDGEARPLPAGEHRLDRPAWLWHDGVAYILLQPAALRVTNDVQRGSWQRINRQGDDTSVEIEMFTASIDHGPSIVDATYAYTIMPGVAAPEAAPAAADDASPAVLVNEPARQAVYFPGTRRVAAVFYEAGQVTLPSGRTVAVDRASALTFTDAADGVTNLHVADMQGQAGTLRLTVDDEAHDVALPGGPHAGQSLAVRMRR
ncbi:MAG: polysaccharide lyase family 8 super-sandwich domain-containing protein [Phycisphaeraceae bacterium]